MKIIIKSLKDQSELCNEDWQCMLQYIKINGWHFNEKLCNLAVALMTKQGKPIIPCTKETIDNLLKTYNITLNNNLGWDYIFVANMGKADYLGSSIPDDHHLALYIKDTIDDEDAGKCAVLRRWCATMTSNKKLINWTSAL